MSKPQIKQENPNVRITRRQHRAQKIIPKTLEFDRYLLWEMATLFIRKPRRNPGYAYVFFFDIGHFPRHI